MSRSQPGISLPTSVSFWVHHLLLLLCPLWIVEPSNSLSVFPDSSSVSSVLSVNSLSVLLSVLPPAFILLSVVPGVNPISMLPVVLVVSFVHSAVLPGVYALSVHVVVLPLAIVLPAIWPDIDSFSINLVFEPFALVH